MIIQILGFDSNLGVKVFTIFGRHFFVNDFLGFEGVIIQFLGADSNLGVKRLFANLWPAFHNEMWGLKLRCSLSFASISQ